MEYFSEKLNRFAQSPPKYKKMSIKRPNEPTLAIREWGNPLGREILFIHGFSEGQLSFFKQTYSELAEKFRMVTLDLRGHGESGKPPDAASYIGRHWADDLKATMDATGLKKPVLVGWSLGGFVIAFYLSTYGDSQIGGINLIGSPVVFDPNLSPPNTGPVASLMQSDDLETNIQGSLAFVHACVAKPLPPEELHFMLALTMMSPAPVRKAVLSGMELSASKPEKINTIFQNTSVPILITWGSADSFHPVARANYMKRKIKGSKLSLYEEIGHSPFWEDPVRFNKELSDFVDGIQ